MSANLAARKQGGWLVVSSSPDVCKTPMGNSTPPVPYPVIAKLDASVQEVPSVKANSFPLVVHDQSKVPATIGDAAGVANGVSSGTVGADCWPNTHSATVRAGQKPLMRHGDEYWMNGRYSGSASAKAARWKQRKAQIAAAKEKLKTMPPGAERDKLAAATERFERNNSAVEKARLSADVYDPKKGPPEGWKNISDDPKALDQYGLKPKDLEKPDSHFRAQVYAPDPDVFGSDMKPTVVFKGTSCGEDWSNNFKQGLNMESPYYENAVKIGTKIEKSGTDMEIAGHSLGGGLASAASRASGRPATTFNAAGLNDKTVARYGGTPQNSDITAYQVDGEVLSGIQEQGWKGALGMAGAGFALAGPKGAAIGLLAKVGLAAAMPDAVGSRQSLPGHGWNPVDRHGMDQVIDGLEGQKKQDQAAIASATGVAGQ